MIAPQTRMNLVHSDLDKMCFSDMNVLNTQVLVTKGK